jgi:hypothetical protein
MAHFFPTEARLMYMENLLAYVQRAIDFLSHPAVAAAVGIVALLIAWLTFRNTVGSPLTETKQKADEPAERRRPLKIAKWKDVLRWGWNGERLLRELIHIDLSTVQGLTDLTEGTTSQWAPVFSNHPDTWRLIVDGDKNIAGYWSFSILPDDLHAKAKRGELVDSEITADKILLEFEGRHKAYFTMIAISAPFRGAESLRLLIDSFFQALDHMAANGVYISEVVANAVSKDGVDMCKHFKMELIAENRVMGTVFAAPIDRILSHGRASEYPNLISKYRCEGLLDPTSLQPPRS